jgi:diguanylate cyclase (GGDEF)-like protein
VVLSTIAGLLSCALRATDAVGRIGGDEFLIVLPGIGRSEAAAVGQRIAETVRQTPIPVVSLPLRPGVSFGVATLDEVRTIEELVERADTRMLAGKRGRRVRRSRGRQRPWTGVGAAAQQET